MQLVQVRPIVNSHLTPLQSLCKSAWLRRSSVSLRLSSRRWNSSKQIPEKPFYVTTPIFYVNGAPHIGHLYCAVLADVAKRWQQINGKQAFLLTGTDEHGMKIQTAAENDGTEPSVFCDANSAKFRSLMNEGSVSYDFFSRTTDSDHKDAVARFWLRLKHALPRRLGLYQGKHSGWYCVSDECFYAESFIRPSLVPQTGKKIMINTETENEVEWIEEETWFFPLTKFRDRLLAFYDENPNWVHPPDRMQEVRNWVHNHLEDLSVTRPAKRLKWGIADPEDSSLTIYVWVDALINYVTKAGFGSKWNAADEDMGIWPADVQIIGKEILRFHAIYWPALLMALDLPLPKRIICHNHWLMSKRKMSKSFGNVVNPFFAIQRWDTDPLRYFLMRNSNFTKDMDYSNDTIAVMYLKEMQACIGNLFLRVVKPKAMVRWSAKEAVQLSVSGAFKHLDAFRENPKHAVYFDLEPYLANTAAEFSEYMKDYNTNDAIGSTWELLSQTNRYLSDCKPWDLVKGDAESCLLSHWVIYRCSEALRIAAILLQPVMPTKTERLLNEMGVKADRRTVAYAKPDTDDEYGPENTSTVEPNFDRSNRQLTLFPPVVSADASQVEELQAFRRRVGLMFTSPVTQMTKLLVSEARMRRGQIPGMPMSDLRDPIPENDIFLERFPTPRATYHEEQEAEYKANTRRFSTLDETKSEASPPALRATLEGFLRGPDDESRSALPETSTNQTRVPTLQSTDKKFGAKPTEDSHQQVPDNMGLQTQSQANSVASHGPPPHGGYWGGLQTNQFQQVSNNMGFQTQSPAIPVTPHTSHGPPPHGGYWGGPQANQFQQVPNNMGFQTQPPANPVAPHGPPPHGGYWGGPQANQFQQQVPENGGFQTPPATPPGTHGDHWGGSQVDRSGQVPENGGFQAYPVTPPGPQGNYWGGPYQGGPYQGGPHRGGPHQGGPYQGEPQQGGPRADRFRPEPEKGGFQADRYRPIPEDKGFQADLFRPLPENGGLQAVRSGQALENGRFQAHPVTSRASSQDSREEPAVGSRDRTEDNERFNTRYSSLRSSCEDFTEKPKKDFSEQVPNMVRFKDQSNPTSRTGSHQDWRHNKERRGRRERYKKGNSRSNTLSNDNDLYEDCLTEKPDPVAALIKSRR